MPIVKLKKFTSFPRVEKTQQVIKKLSQEEIGLSLISDGNLFTQSFLERNGHLMSAKLFLLRLNYAS